MFDRQYDSQAHPDHGAPALPTRRMVSILFLKGTSKNLIFNKCDR
jgi:hypothetical protein